MRTRIREVQRPAAEVLYREELERLGELDRQASRPEGWRLSPSAVLRFVLGDPEHGIEEKFVGSRAQVERAIVALATHRGLMLIGEPGTAKSFLSELLAAAISGDSTLVIQGSAATTDDTIKYSWNYALLLAEGPSERSLVPAPLYLGLSEGKLVRFEEITRCPLEVQDSLLSVLSDRVLAIPELEGEERTLFARHGFNVIATANTRDRGVNEMSAALKRRFNFETIPPIPSLEQEMALVKRQTDALLAQAAVPARLGDDVTELLVTTFHELRRGKADGKAVDAPTTVMSTAEAVAVGVAAGLQAHYFAAGEVRPGHLVQSLVGTALKDEPEDLGVLRRYFEQVVRSRSGEHWREYYEARRGATGGGVRVGARPAPAALRRARRPAGGRRWGMNDAPVWSAGD
ncbi:MAG: AAA family ATPase [bacterium]|nr:AAA family ATPase [bacterium]